MSDDRAAFPLPPPPPAPPGKRRQKDEDGGVITSGKGPLASKAKGPALPPPKANTPEYTRWRREEKLTELDWRNVLAAFGETGEVKVIAEKTKLSTQQVKHLLDFGLMRFNLPSVREVATDQKVVNKKVEKLIDASIVKAIMQTNEDKERALQVDPQLRDAVTQRAIRETAGAQAALIASVSASDVLVGYVNKLLNGLKDGTTNFAIPEEVTPGFLETLSKAINNLTTATGKAIEQSRLTAGEPTQNVAVHIASFTASLSKEELFEYVQTGVVPTHLRVRGGSRDSVERAKPAKQAKIIDVVAEQADDTES